MIVKPDDDTTKVLARLGRSTDWKVLEDWLGKCRESCVVNSFCESEVRSRQAQGAVLAIDELIRHTTAAVELSTRR